MTDYANPFLGTATLWEQEDLGYIRRAKARTWGAETFPGATLPNTLVQLSPVTHYRSGSGYQYEDTVILAFRIPTRAIGIYCMFRCCRLLEKDCFFVADENVATMAEACF